MPKSEVMASRRNFIRQAGWLSLSPALTGAVGPGRSRIGIDLAKWSSLNDDAFFALVREQLLIPDGRIYLNTGSLGPSTLQVIDTVYEAMRELEMNPAAENWGPLGQKMEAVRQIIADYIRTEKDNILLTRNTTEGLSLVAQSIRLNPGDEILTTDQEHGGALVGLEYTAANQGAVIRKMTIPMPTQSTGQILETLHANDRENQNGPPQPREHHHRPRYAFC